MTEIQRDSAESDADKIAAWDQIAEAWATYCNQGAGVFDWDYDSRDLMGDLTGNRPFQWVGLRGTTPGAEGSHE